MVSLVSPELDAQINELHKLVEPLREKVEKLRELRKNAPESMKRGDGYVHEISEIIHAKDLRVEEIVQQLEKLKTAIRGDEVLLESYRDAFLDRIAKRNRILLRMEKRYWKFSQMKLHFRHFWKMKLGDQGIQSRQLWGIFPQQKATSNIETPRNLQNLL